MITLATLPQATAQEVFDQVRDHLLQQNSKSELLLGIAQVPTCAYRGENNKKCAAGCLIADDEYSIDMEGQLYTRLPTVPEEHKGLISVLQSCHDSWDVNEWEERLKQIAENNNFIWK